MAAQAPGQSDGFGDEVDIAGVAFVEDEVEGGEDGSQVTGPVEALTGDGAPWRG
jgi:hypothetical protein